MSKTVLFTRPWNDEGTCYLHAWTQILIDKARKQNHNVIDLDKTRANREMFSGHLRKSKPTLVHLNGHGSNTVVTGDQKLPLLDQDNANHTRGMVIYARSCNSAAMLGRYCVEQGAKSYIGYRRPFVVRLDLAKMQRPLEDEIAAYTLEPSNQVTLSLLGGATAGESYERSQKTSREKLQKLMSSEAPEGASHILMAVWSNMNNQVILGQPDATI